MHLIILDWCEKINLSYTNCEHILLDYMDMKNISAKLFSCVLMGKQKQN